MKKIISIFVIIFIIFNNFLVFSLNELVENKLYYLDTDNNSKIDRLEIEFNNELTGALNPDKLFLYSNTGGLSSSKLDSVSGTSIFSSYSLSGNILILNLVEQDNAFTGLIINNTTSSHLRIKTNAGVGIKDIYGNEIKLLYTSSFSNYTNVAFKQNQIVENIPDVLVDTGTENTINPEILPEIDNSIVDSSTGIVDETGSILENVPSYIIASGSLEEDYSTGTINNFTYKTQILFQSPSYLLEKDDSESTIFNCDTSKTDCKVNYNLNMDLGNGFVSVPSDYECIWNFGFSGATGEENKCNPNTVTYPIGEYETTYKIIDKINQNNYIEKKIKIKNQGYKPIITTQTVYVSSNSSNTSNQAILILSPKINIQSGLDENNNCKNADCSVNLSYKEQNTKEACLWDFSGATYDVGTENKCNPGYLKYPIGNFKVKLRVYELGNESNYKESFINISNSLKLEILDAGIKSNDKVMPENTVEVLKQDKFINPSFSGNLEISQILANPVGKDDSEWIEIQNTGDNQVNLNGCEIDNILKTSTKKYKIKEDIFLDPEDSIKLYKSTTNLTIRNTSGRDLELLCNNQKLDSISWSFDTPEGFVVNKSLLDKTVSSIENLADENIFVLNYADGTNAEIPKYEETKIISLPKLASGVKQVLSNSEELKSIIEVQGKIGKDKILSRDRIICKNMDECSVNLDGRESKGKDLLYFWDFGNGKTFEKANPASYIFKIGKHIISLKVSSKNKEDISYFIIEVLAKEGKTKLKTTKKDDNIADSFIPTVEASNDAVKETKNDNIKYTYIFLLVSSRLSLLGFALKKKMLL